VDCNDLYSQWGEEKFRAELHKLDAETAARLAPNDRQRSIRAYEVVLHTGKPLRFWHEQAQASSPYSIESHLRMPSREELYAACDKRFLQMINQGAVEELKNMLVRKLDPSLPAMKTLGVREITDYLHDKITLDEAIARAQQATRNYAKRQLTWFRNQWKY
jgi:tRNA dimethylallyltransferase